MRKPTFLLFLIMILEGCEPRFASIHHYWWPGGVRRKSIPIDMCWISLQGSKSAIWVTKLGATFGILHIIFGLLGLHMVELIRPPPLIYLVSRPPTADGVNVGIQDVSFD